MTPTIFMMTLPWIVTLWCVSFSICPFPLPSIAISGRYFYFYLNAMPNGVIGHLFIRGPVFESFFISDVF
jgi:hypothetical protein